MVHLLVALLLFSSPAAARQLPPADAPQELSGPARHEPREMVVLVHGMGRTPMSMLPLAKRLEREGYEVLNWGYSSLCCSIAELGEQLRREVRQRQGATPRRVHFVGHSLGNIIIRQMLTQEDAPEDVGHVVMLAPPNQGSQEADRHARRVGWLLRPIDELRTDPASTVRKLPRLESIPVGVIAGKHDGKVSLQETHLPEETAHVVVRAAHTFLMLRADVQQLVIGFLREASFPTVNGVEAATH
jgi:triacylglycerol lipase